jgi:nucleoside-diphosphate-sugar epimerase
MIISAHGLNIPIQLDSTKPDGQLKKVLDVEKAKRLLSWQAKISLNDGLKGTAKWYREQLG